MKRISNLLGLILFVLVSGYLVVRRSGVIDRTVDSPIQSDEQLAIQPEQPALMPDATEIAPDEELLQKFLREGGPSRVLKIAEPSPPVWNAESLKFQKEIEKMDWVQMCDRSSQLFPEDKRPLAERLLQQTGHGRYYLAVTNLFFHQPDAARYWFQEAFIEEGLTMDELKLIRTLLESKSDLSEEDKLAVRQIEKLAHTVAGYWKQADRDKPRLHLPADHPADKPISLVVCLHPDRLSPAFWEPDFCNQLAEQFQIAVLVPTATDHFGPNGYHWTEDFANRYDRDYQQIEKSLAELANQFQEKRGQRLLIGFHQSAYMVLNITGHHPDQYAGASLIHPATVDAIAERSQSFFDAAKMQKAIQQRLYLLYQPEEFREKLSAFISKTLAPTGRQVELKLDSKASFVYPKQLTIDSELAPKVLEAIRAVLPN